MDDELLFPHLHAACMWAGEVLADVAETTLEIYAPLVALPLMLLGWLVKLTAHVLDACGDWLNETIDGLI